MDTRSILRRAALFYAEKPAVVAGGREYSFATCWMRGVRLYNGLRSMGLLAGDRVGILDNNAIAGVDFYIACAIGNFVRVPLYWRNSADVNLLMIRKAECRLVAVSGLMPQKFLQAEDDLPYLTKLFSVDEQYESWLAGQSELENPEEISEDDLCLIRFTGGTTGEPKGIPNTHRQWIAVGRDDVSFKPRICAGESMLHVAPLSHASGYYFLPAWAHGARQILGSGLHADEIVSLMSAQTVSHAFMPPTLLNMIIDVRGVADNDWSGLKTLAIGSAPIGIGTLNRAAEVFGRRVFYQTYGTSEAVPIAGMGPDAWFAEVEGSEPEKAVGKPLPFTDVEVWSEDGVALEPGELGEIVVRCDGQMSGYWKDPVQTEKKIVKGRIRTGDIGKVDLNGYLYLTDRVGEMIVSGGHNIYPGELEKAIASHADILEVCVFGVPDQKWGETPVAVCRKREGSQVSEDEVIKLVADNLGSYMKPSKVQFLARELPKSAVGKISRRAAREMYCRDHVGTVHGV